MNLDPAVYELPYQPQIDIRDTVDYKKVMSDYKLGPNGAIMTCLNLFTTKFDQVLESINGQDLDYVVIDTPGQIEVFTWSASGTIISESLSQRYPTAILYTVDTPRCKNPATFMSNMLYACSIMYKFNLKFCILFNKIDLENHSFAVEWMTDFESLQESLNGEDYMSSLVHSMSLVLEEFYNNIPLVGVSAITGEGIDEFFPKIENLLEEKEIESLSDLKLEDS